MLLEGWNQGGLDRRDVKHEWNVIDVKEFSSKNWAENTT
jgi:hypothetical protein